MPINQRRVNVILRGDGEPVSLLVDRIGEVVDLDDETFEPPPPRYTRGVLAKYARLVGSASRGAVCD